MTQNNYLTFIGIGVLHLVVGIGLAFGLPIAGVSSIASVTQTIGIPAAAGLFSVIGVLALCSMLLLSIQKLSATQEEEIRILRVERDRLREQITRAGGL